MRIITVQCALFCSLSSCQLEPRHLNIASLLDRRMAVCHSKCSALEPDQDVSARSRRLNRLRKRLEALSAGSAEVLADFCEAVDC